MIYTKLLVVVSLSGTLTACRTGSRTALSPTEYVWPDSFTFKMEFVAESRADTALVVRYEERKELVLAAREERYLAWHDSVVKESVGPGRPAVVEPYAPEDTLHYYIELDRRGRVSRSEPGCDPGLPPCRAVLPSALPLELLRLVPRLPVWTPPRGSTWEDTLVFDDTPRPGGVRGSVVTVYRVAGDTVVAGTPLWTVVWRSVHRAFALGPGAATFTAGAPVEESGLVYIDKERAVPVFAMWGGAAAASSGLRAAGVTVTAFRGRAYLAGSVVERVLGPPE